MKKSNFHHLIMRYVSRKTSAGQTAKIEAMLRTIKSRKIHFFIVTSQSHFKVNKIRHLEEFKNRLQIPLIKRVGTGFSEGS